MKNEKDDGSKAGSDKKQGSENEKHERSRPSPEHKKKTTPTPKNANPDEYKNMPGNQT